MYGGWVLSDHSLLLFTELDYKEMCFSLRIYICETQNV